MLPFGLNHMTAPHLTATELLTLGGQLNCVGVEFRNDLDRPLFVGASPAAIADLAKDKGLRILALAEVKAFNDPSADAVGQARALSQIANACGAEGIALIPKVASGAVPRDAQRAVLRASLDALRPVLEDQRQVGLIEPLGFEASTLRYKDDAVAVLDDMGRPDCFALIHDTFHHFLAETDSIQAELTALVHVSGVENLQVNARDFTDAHRVLVGQGDRLENTAQLRELARAGYTGPASFEAFAPEVHDMTDPAKALAGSINFIADQLIGEPA